MGAVGSSLGAVDGYVEVGRVMGAVEGQLGTVKDHKELMGAVESVGMLWVLWGVLVYDMLCGVLIQFYVSYVEFGLP